MSTLYSFSGTTDGGYPLAGLVQAADGNLYGTTNAGTIFKINPGGTLTTLHTFNGTDGANPLGLVQATDGNFYGTTTIGGSTGAGTVFKMTQTGILTTLHSFNGTDGGYPYAGLVQATDGTFYGTTQAGGAHNKGTIFSLCVGLGWHTEELPGYGKVGDTIKILGTDLTGASSVSFGGIAAPYTVVSPTLIQATVPPGAKTGYVSVVLPSGKIPSNKKFRVTPQITSFSPDNGPAGTLVIITGVSLSQAKTVGISGKSTSFTVIDDTTLTATVPTGATTAKIRITTQGGTATAATNFTVD